MIAGAGNDTLIGGEGDDEMTGGSGADLYQFAGSSGHDEITDFAYGEDKIELQDITFVEGDPVDDGEASLPAFLTENATIDGEDLYLDLGDGMSIKLIGVVDEENIGEDVEDYLDIFAV